MSRKLFLTSTVAAAVVATSVVPTTALAAQATDINKLHPTDKAFVEKSIELGYFLDRPTFNPDQPITRGQAAKTLAREVTGGQTIDDYKAFVEKEGLEKKVTPFKDVPVSYKTGTKSQQELYYVSLIVKNAGAFTQDHLLPNQNTKRSQMAKMVVEIFKLEDTGKAVNITDLNLIHEKDRKYVQIAAQHGLTTVSKFNPYGELKRSQMAKFLVQANGAKSEVEEPEEIKVEKVVAEAQTVDLKDTVTFKINDEKQAITAAELPEGYKAKFKASKSVFAGATEPSLTSTSGVIHEKVAAGTKFDVEIEILDKDNKVVATSKVVKIDVADYSKIVESIERVEAKVNGQDVRLSEIALNDIVDIRVFAKVKNQKDAKEITDFKLATDKPAVLSVQSDKTLKAKAKGTVELTVEVGEAKSKHTFKVNDSRKVDVKNSSLEPQVMNLAKEKTGEVELIVKDQYNVAMNLETTAIKVKEVETGLLKGPVTVTKEKEAGHYTIKLTAGTETKKGELAVTADGTEIGKVKVDVQKAGDEAETYKASVKNAQFDKAKNGNRTQTVTLRAFDKDGLELANQPVIDGKKIQLVSTNTKTVTVKENQVTLTEQAVAGETVTVNVMKIEGAIEKKLAELKFTVVDSTPVIREVQFTSEPAITEETKDFDLSSIMKVMTKDGSTEADVETIFVDGEGVKKGEVQIQTMTEKPEAAYGVGKVSITFDGKPLLEGGPIAVTVKDGKIYLTAVSQEKAVKGILKIGVTQNDTFVEKGGTFEVKMEAKK